MHGVGLFVQYLRSRILNVECRTQNKIKNCNAVTQRRLVGRLHVPQGYAEKNQATQGQRKSNILDRIYMIYRIWLMLLNLKNPVDPVDPVKKCHS